MADDEDGPGGRSEARVRAVDGERAAAGDEGAGDDGGVAWLYLLGLLAFVGSAIAFAADLATGHDVLRSVAANGLAAVLLVTWAGLDSFRDPDSGVTTASGAVGTGVILVGVYLLAAGAVVAATGVVHGRLVVGLATIGAAVPVVLGGFLVFPADVFLGEEADGEGLEERSGVEDGSPGSERTS
jgi:hypothetical protein